MTNVGGATESSHLLTADSSSGEHGEGKIRSHGNQGHHHHHGSVRRLHESVPLYAKPMQRQRWDDVQVLPHVNWGDLYFDLFYVAAAYQLSHAFKDSPTYEGLFYFFASYFPMFLIWQEKLLYDARYSNDDNLFYRAVEVFHLCMLGLAVSCIQPAEIMKDTYNNSTMTLFTGAYLCDTIALAYMYMDIRRNAICGEEAKSNALLELVRKAIGGAFYVAAFAISAHDYFTGSNRSSWSESEDGDERSNYLPAALLIAGFVVEFVYTPVFAFLVIPKWNLSHKQVMVPINLEFTIHRIGEWVMLMLGESVLSILTSPTNEATSTPAYRVSFFAGILTVTMFQYLFFRTQPSEAKDHAMRRSQGGGFTFLFCHIFYSASLILVGCCYKMMLSEQEMMNQAEEEEVEYDVKERIALVYAASQTISFLALDNMTISHRGFGVNFSRFRITDSNGNKQWATIPWIVFFIELLLLAATVGLSQVHDLQLLSVYGCLLVFGQVMLRTFGLRYFPVTIAQMERALHPQDYTCISSSGKVTFDDVDGDQRRWPNVTEPATTPKH